MVEKLSYDLTLSHDGEKYCLLYHDKESDDCIQAYVYENVEDVFTDIQHFIDRDTWSWNIGKQSQEEINHCNIFANLRRQGMCVSSSYILNIRNGQVKICPLAIPDNDKYFFCKKVMSKLEIIIPLNHFKLGL